MAVQPVATLVMGESTFLANLRALSTGDFDRLASGHTKTQIKEPAEAGKSSDEGGVARGGLW